MNVKSAVNIIYDSDLAPDLVANKVIYDSKTGQYILVLADDGMSYHDETKNSQLIMLYLPQFKYVRSERKLNLESEDGNEVWFYLETK